MDLQQHREKLVKDYRNAVRQREAYHTIVTRIEGALQFVDMLISAQAEAPPAEPPTPEAPAEVASDTPKE